MKNYRGRLYWRRASKEGAIVGLIAGVLVNTYFQVIVRKAPLDIHAGIWGLAVNLALFICISLLTKPKDEKVVEEFINA